MRARWQQLESAVLVVSRLLELCVEDQYLRWRGNVLLFRLISAGQDLRRIAITPPTSNPARTIAQLLAASYAALNISIVFVFSDLVRPTKTFILGLSGFNSAALLYLGLSALSLVLAACRFSCLTRAQFDEHLTRWQRQLRNLRNQIDRGGLIPWFRAEPLPVAAFGAAALPAPGPAEGGQQLWFNPIVVAHGEELPAAGPAGAARGGDQLWFNPIVVAQDGAAIVAAGGAGDAAPAVQDWTQNSSESDEEAAHNIAAAPSSLGRGR